MAQKQGGLQGLAGLYNRKEIKRFISGYLLSLSVIEGLIFFFCWISFLSGQVPEFPWKAYLIASFITPVAITFILGMVVFGFNRYLFSHQAAAGTSGEEKKGHARLDELLTSMQRIPFLVSLLLLVAAGGVIYKLDAITAFIVNTGEHAARYLFYVLGTVLGVAALVVMVWMVLSYRLRRRRLELLHEFRQELVSRTGMVMLEDETLIDREGQVIDLPPEQRAVEGVKSGELTLLPPLRLKRGNEGSKKGPLG